MTILYPIGISGNVDSQETIGRRKERFARVNFCIYLVLLTGKRTENGCVTMWEQASVS